MLNKADSKEEVLHRLLETRPQLVRLGVRAIGLFGSFVRNEQTPSSDVDILVEFSPGKHTFDNFMDMLDEIDYVTSQLPGRDFESFAADPTLKRAFVRSLEVIGDR
jgi:hypothetical protein